MFILLGFCGRAHLIRAVYHIMKEGKGIFKAMLQTHNERVTISRGGFFHQIVLFISKARLSPGFIKTLSKE